MLNVFNKCLKGLTVNFALLKNVTDSNIRFLANRLQPFIK